MARRELSYRRRGVQPDPSGGHPRDDPGGGGLFVFIGFSPALLINRR
jgi:hypothetical protein